MKSASSFCRKQARTAQQLQERTHHNAVNKKYTEIPAVLPVGSVKNKPPAYPSSFSPLQPHTTAPVPPRSQPSPRSWRWPPARSHPPSSSSSSSSFSPGFPRRSFRASDQTCRKQKYREGKSERTWERSICHWNLEKKAHGRQEEASVGGSLR